MEKWTFLVMADDDGNPNGLRVILRAGDDEDEDYRHRAT